jgi:hypothetical protein
LGEDGWQQEKPVLLGKLPDDEVAAQLGRTPNAVRVKRNKLHIPRPGTANAC